MLTDAAPWRWTRALLLVYLAATLWGGCSPDDFLVADEDRERNFQKARDAIRMGDLEAATEYFERAVERNPRSAAIHLSYASFCDSELRRYPDAVYHYQRFLRLAPDDSKADLVRKRITNCTERLATSVPLVVRSETIARDLEAVRNENLVLRSQVTNLFAASGYWSNECRRAAVVIAQNQGQLQQFQQQLQASEARVAAAAAAARTGSGTSNSAPVLPAPGGNLVRPVQPGRAGTTPAPGRVPEAPAASRIHRVQSGETLDRIARQYGVPLRALQQANPRVDARHLKAGTELRIPSPAATPARTSGGR